MRLWKSWNEAGTPPSALPPPPPPISSLLRVSKVVSLTCTVTKLDKEQLQWNPSFGTSPFRGHKIWSRKNGHLIFVFVTSVEGTPLFRGKGHLFCVPKHRFNLHFGDTLALEKWLTTKSVDKFKCTPARMTEAFTTWSISLKSIYCTCGNSTYNVAEISLSWFCIHYLAAWNNDCSRFRGRI